jgi:hypothetical protein
MPKLNIHREVAHKIGIELSDTEMREIDYRLDGIKGDNVHDPWKSSVSDFKKVIDWTNFTYGSQGVKYGLLHAVLDTAEEGTLSGKTRENPSAHIFRDFAHIIAFRYALEFVSHMIKESLQEYSAYWDELSASLKDDEKTLAEAINQLPEIESAVSNIERFKQKRNAAESLAKQYPNAKHVQIPIYTDFIMELRSKKRWKKPKDEWATELMKKYCESGGLNNETREKIRADFVDIAKRLGYI